VAVACMLILPFAVISDDLIRFGLSADAHRCCASTNGDCAQLNTPDDCCQTQQQAASHGYTSLAPNTRLQFVAGMDVTAPVEHARNLVQPPHVVELSPLDAFKRPHDPPHLHSFPLLI
jgi:hypothetical protein